MTYPATLSLEQKNQLAKNFEAIAWQELSLNVKQWVDHNLAHKAVEKQIDTHLQRATDISKVKKFSQVCKVEGSAPKDYLNRVVEYQDGHHALLGIRFKGLDITQPFVDVLAKDSVFTPENLENLIRVSRQEFGLFQPKWLRIELTGPSGSLLNSFNFEPDLRTLLGPISQLQAKDKPPRYEEIQLTRCTDLTFYPHYKQDYEEFNANAGVMADEVHLSSENEFQELVDFGHTYRATIDGQWAGVIAFSQSDLFGTSTLVVHEELLTKRHRGQGFGAALQRHAIERVDPSTYSLLIGTIHSNNTPSLRTATRIGRIDIGGYWFLEL